MFTFSPADVQLINNSIYILENISVGLPILYISVSDRDNGINGRVTMELESPVKEGRSLFQLEKLTENTYSLRTNAPLDREEQSTYSFTLIASDQGQPRRSMTSLFELHLIDVNDCSPRFDHPHNYSFSIDENQQDNLMLQTIRVSDPDENDHLTTRLIFDTDASAKALFKLNELNELIVLKSLDYEQRAQYQFAIQVEDSVGHQTSTPVFIHVNDLNDNPVRFVSNVTQYQLEENQENRTYLGQIQAEDADQHDLITYAIHTDDFDRVDKFIELSPNGSLFTKISFDREQIDQLEFRSMVNDSLHIDTMFIQITILDQNDHQPVLKNSSPFCYVYNISSNNNELLHIQLEAEDLDDGINGQILFSLKKSSSSDLVLSPNGTITVPSILRSYQFDLHLEDQGQPNRLSSMYKDFILLIVSNQFECDTFSVSSPLHLDQKTLIYCISLILICLACFVVIILGICCCFYMRQQQQRRRKLSSTHKTPPNLTPSFSSSLNGEAENDTLLLSSPSPQFTAMTTVSGSTTTTNDSTRLTTFLDRPTNKSSSLSSSSSSTYVKMSHSFEDEML